MSWGLPRLGFESSVAHGGGGGAGGRALTELRAARPLLACSGFGFGLWFGFGFGFGFGLEWPLLAVCCELLAEHRHDDWLGDVVVHARLIRVRWSGLGSVVRVRVRVRVGVRVRG